MDRKAVVAEAVKRAQKISQEEGLIPGKTVAHPDDPIAYELISVDGSIATVGLSANCSPNGKEVRKQFLLKELFNPHVACKQLDSVIEEEVNKSVPPGFGILVVKL